MGENKKSVMIIGGGLGGVSAAIALSTRGYDVTIFEKNSHLCGKLNVLKKEGFSFDLGPSILTMPSIFEKLFTDAGKKMADYVKIIKIDHEWRNFFEDGKILDLYSDIKDMKDKNPLLSESDIKDYQEFMLYSKKIYELTNEGYFEKGLDTLYEVLKFYLIKKPIQQFDYFSTVADGVERYIKNEYLQHVMEYFVKYVGSAATYCPAVLNLLPYIQSEFGLWYVEGGLFNLAEALMKLAKDTGVKVNLASEVVKMDVVEKKVNKIYLKDGTSHFADIYVSNMEVLPAYKRLANQPESVLKKMDKFEPACSGLVLHLGVKKKYPQLAHHNFFYSKDPKANFKRVFRDYKLPDDPTLYVVNVNKTDKTQCPEGYENIKILPHIPYIQSEPFTKDDYYALRERVIRKMERMGIADLEKNIVVEDMWTPEDIESNYYSNKGAIYGVVSDKKKNKGFKFPKKSSLFSNLFFVGGSVNPGGGMPMAVLSGQQVCNMIENLKK